MAKYSFRLDEFIIDNTRSRHEDTDFVTIGLKVGDRPLRTLTKAMGNLNNGEYSVGLVFNDIEVDRPDTPVIFNFQIVNSGHQSQEAIDSALTSAASKLAASAATNLGDQVLPGTGSIWGAVAGQLVDWLGGILFANCDGPVAADQIVVNGATLAAWTAQGTHNEKRFYPGTDSAHGCGSNSKYSVAWSIAQLTPSPQPTPSETRYGGVFRTGNDAWEVVYGDSYDYFNSTRLPQLTAKGLRPVQLVVTPAGDGQFHYGGVFRTGNDAWEVVGIFDEGKTIFEALTRALLRLESSDEQLVEVGEVQILLT